MIDRIKLPFNFEVELLQNDLSKISKLEWIDHFVRQNYDGNWTVFPLRSQVGATHPIKMVYYDPSITEFENTSFLNDCPYFQKVLATFKCPLQNVRLMKLTPGSIIKEHIDYDLAAEEGFARIHVPIKTNSEVVFTLNGKRVIMNEGECWYLRLSDPHSVENSGKTDRVHMVIDAIVNDWLKERLIEMATKNELNRE